MSSYHFKTSLFAMNVVERLINTRLEVSGDSFLTDKPILYVINHFTRAETLILPYVIYKATGKYSHSLANKALFKGALGDYLTSMGVVSTAEKDRDLRIIRDLLTGENNWTIYPEGAMIKSKQIVKRGKLVLTTPGRIGPAHTGASILALKAEIYRKRYIACKQEGNEKALQALRNQLDMEDLSRIKLDSAVIIPVSISYYPLRPGQNIIKKMVHKFFDEMPERLAEELEIEGNILMNKTDMNIHFSEPVEIKNYLTGYNKISNWIPILGELDKKNFLIKRAGVKLTNDFMKTIYTRIQINLDNLYCCALKYLKNPMAEDVFMKRLYLLIDEYRNNKRYRLHPDLINNASNLLNNPDWEPFKSIRQLAIDKEVLTVEDGMMKVNSIKFSMMQMFHHVRVQNPLVVIANELEPCKDLVTRLRRYMNYPGSSVETRIFSALLDEDIARFDRDYNDYYEENFSKDKTIGAPIYLEGTNNIGIVLSHGYLAAPAEIAELAQHLNSQGFSVYGLRLPGHGTSPHNLSKINWQEWVWAYLRGYSLLKQKNDKIIFGGFSTGGTIALIAATMVKDITCIFNINPPVKMADINATMATAVHHWNSFLEAIHVDTGQWEYIDDKSRNPAVNYERIYVNSLHELDQLMDHCRDCLSKVKQDFFLINSSNDPTVDPSSSEYVYKHIGSENKKRIVMNADEHIIVLGKYKEEAFKNLDQFLGQYVNNSSAT